MYKGPYKNLKIWQKRINLTKRVYFFTRNFPREEVYSLTDQLRRCSVSIPSNIAEGSRRSSNKEFSNFILIARGSLAELETQMIIAEQVGYIDKNKLNDLLIFSFHKKLQTTNSKLPTSQ